VEELLRKRGRNPGFHLSLIGTSADRIYSLIREETIVFPMIAYPEPDQVSFMLDRQCSVPQANPDRPIVSSLFEVQ